MGDPMSEPITGRTPSWPSVDAFLYASKEDTPVGRALAMHYPAQNGDGPDTCAVCYFYAGGGFTDITAEPWPCPTVRALMPPARVQWPEAGR